MRRSLLVLIVAGVVVTLGACSGETNEVSGPTDRSATSASDDTPSDPEADGSSDAAADAAPGGSDDADAGDDGSEGGDPGSTGRTPASKGASPREAGGGDDAADDGDGGRSDDGDTPAPSGGSRPAPSPTAPPATFTPDPDRYREYVRLTEELGGEVASETDATALASVFCTDPAGSGQTYLDGQPLGSYPSDLALVRAYCPEAESQF